MEEGVGGVSPWRFFPFLCIAAKPLGLELISAVFGVFVRVPLSHAFVSSENPLFHSLEFFSFFWEERRGEERWQE